MLHTLNNGDRVKVWPMPGLAVKFGPDAFIDGRHIEQRAISAAGETVTWGAWFHDLAKQGALLFSDPRHEKDGGPKGSGGHRKAQHVRHPHEWVSEFGKPAMHLLDEELAQSMFKRPLESLNPIELEAMNQHIAWHLAPNAKGERDAKRAEEAQARIAAESAEATRAAELRGEAPKAEAPKADAATTEKLLVSDDKQ